MEMTTNTKKANASQKGAGGVLVWDLPVRVFHWSLVILVSAAAGTGFLAPEWWLDIHVWSGYGVGALIIFRLIWGFAGTGYARFSSFWFSTGEIKNHIHAMIRRHPAHYTGHNPAGALMVFGLLAILAAIGVSGLVVLGGQENQGILAGFVSYFVGDIAEEVHEFLAIILLFMIGAHLLGVLVESVLSKENLVRAMVTGCKTATESKSQATRISPSIFRAMIIIAVILFSGGASSWALSLVPPSGVVALPVNADFASECGECHIAFHPSLLPAASWRAVMAGLPDHFGEDASLDKDTEKNISAYLSAYASERWDTEAANNFRRPSAQNPLSIVAAPYWQRRHKEILEAVFKRKTITSKSNCAACHEDARTGRFDDQMIMIPGPQPKIKSTRT